jgi:hypothetical protein
MPSPLHPHYDEVGVVYDGAFFYSDGLPDVPTPTPENTRMASLSPGFSRLNVKQLIALAELVASKLAPAAPATPPLPNMAAKVTALSAASTAAKTADDTYEAAKAALVNLKATRDQKADELRMAHKSCASAVESEAGGEETLLSASGYALAAVATPGVPVAQISNLSVTASSMDGALDAVWDPDPSARTYDVQVTTVDPVAGPWVTRQQPTGSAASVDGLTSGNRVWIRVRGVGPKGPGPWSDPATKIVP